MNWPGIHINRCIGNCCFTNNGKRWDAPSAPGSRLTVEGKVKTSGRIWLNLKNEFWNPEMEPSRLCCLGMIGRRDAGLAESNPVDRIAAERGKLQRNLPLTCLFPTVIRFKRWVWRVHGSVSPHLLTLYLCVSHDSGCFSAPIFALLCPTFLYNSPKDMRTSTHFLFLSFFFFSIHSSQNKQINK